MKSILLQIYDGEVSGYENLTVVDTEYREVNKKIENEKRYFVQKMSLDDCQRFQALEALYNEASEMENKTAFVYGFKLGAAIMCEVFKENRESISTKN